MVETDISRAPSLGRVLADWGRIGCVGFGGPPAHIALLRELCVRNRRWLADAEFEDALAACNLLPGPASTQLAIYCAWRVRGRVGALVGGAAFILPGLLVIVALAALFLAGSPPRWVRGAGAGAGAAVAAVALHAGWGLLRARPVHGVRTVLYVLAGAACGALAGPWVVLVLLGCGLIELAARRAPALASFAPLPLAWVALKVGALSYGGGFVIVPLMQGDAVNRYHWLTATQFLNAVALGQVTPGPVTHTVAVVGYGAAGVGGALLAALVAFAPSFAFVLLGGGRFDRIRGDERARRFFAGAGPAAIGAILGSSIPLARALTEPWQFGVLGAAALLLLALRRGVVETLVLAGLAGALAVVAGAPLPH